jgi:zinc transporter, ZIP family
LSILQVFLCALATAVATGFGALPFIFVKSLSRRWLGASNAVAAGLMLAASFGLIYEGVNYGLLRTLGGALIGLGFIVLVRRVLQRDEHPAVFTGMSGMDAHKALLIVGVMTVHSFTEGVGVGVSFGGGVGLAYSSRLRWFHCTNQPKLRFSALLAASGAQQFKLVRV